MEREFRESLADEATELNHEAYGRGAKLFDQGRYSLAKNEFRLALEYRPEDAEAWMALGNCFDELKRPAKAEECFRQALRFCSEDQQDALRFNLGNALFDQHRFDEAVACYQNVSAQSQVYKTAQINIVRARRLVD